MRNMSFMLTTRQINDQSKTVTRRLGWKFLKPGDLICAVEKSQGLKRGEKVNRLATIRIIKTSFEPLNTITLNDVVREGFPEYLVSDFIRMFCLEMCVGPKQLVNRIEFEYVDHD